jgi:sulfatase maturation enzyme AslB (radical SAM superfamily)
MNLSINPTYYCNFRCDFCYLTEKQLSDKKVLSLETLHRRLDDISQYDIIDKVDLYGGELGILSKRYWDELISLLQMHGIHDINLITNLSMINEITLDKRVYTSVSYDFEAREDHERVYKNMALLDKPFSILMLASPKFLEIDTEHMINSLNLLPNLESVEIKPYSSNQSNTHTVYYTDFEKKVKSFFQYEKKFNFVNEDLLESVLNKQRNSFSDDHVYITPSGNFAVLEFDLNDNEFFLEYDTYEKYKSWCQKEKQRVGKNKFCSSCEYFGNCLSEHLREVKNLDDSCNGFKHLIDWFKNGRMES